MHILNSGGFYMAQLTIYLEKEVVEKISKAALIESQSVSKWVRNRILKDLEPSTWPENYFDQICGSLENIDFERPPQSIGLDGKREKL